MPTLAPISAPNAPASTDLLALKNLSKEQLYRLLVAQMGKQKLGLNWESSAIDRDAALNADVVLPRLVADLCATPAPRGGSGGTGRDSNPAAAHYKNLIIEGDNFDSLRLLRSTHAGKIRVIYIDPPYNTGNKDWVYNDRYVGANDRYRHSQWLEFLYRRLSLARELLTPDGVILVSINDENRSRLELLMDEVFPGMRVGSLVWRTKDTGNDLSQRFSHVHEHILVYGNTGFKFNGKPTDRSKFRNTDADARGDWSPQPLTKAHTYLERENTYYPIQNPATGYWYPCDPNRVWAYASETEIRKRLGDDEAAVQASLAGLRSDTIEQLIAKELIYFPPCKAEELMLFSDVTALEAAIAAGVGPMLPKKKTPLLRKDLPDLAFWVGKSIATGRPSRKEHWSAKPETDRLAPLSSWIAGINETVASDEDNELLETEVLRSARGGVATEELKNILGGKNFPYPKPLSLIKGLLAQATRPDDIVLDFFAGSGTTGQAVLELNAEDGGQRRFILCSSTEATDKEPEKNICRDVCAERMRRVIAGVAGHQGFTHAQGGEFAYLQLDKLEAADLLFEAQPAHAAQLLSLRRFGVVQDFSPQFASLSYEANEANEADKANKDDKDAIIKIGRVDDCDILLCERVTLAVLERLAAWPAPRIAVYSHRPSAMHRLLQAKPVDANCHSTLAALRQGQVKPRKKTKVTPSNSANRSD
jgi:adenine-specific DNA-methyltransferase